MLRTESLTPEMDDRLFLFAKGRFDNHRKFKILCQYSSDPHKPFNLFMKIKLLAETYLLRLDNIVWGDGLALADEIETYSQDFTFENNDTFVMSRYPNQNYNGAAESGYHPLKVGKYDNTTGECHSYLQTKLNLQNVRVTQATLHVFNKHTYHNTKPTHVWLNRVDGAWNAKTLNWTTASKIPSNAVTSKEVRKGHEVVLDVTGIVQGWIDNPASNHGIKLHTNGNGQSFWQKYSSSRDDHPPHLTVTYTRVVKSKAAFKAEIFHLAVNDPGQFSVELDHDPSTVLKTSAIYSAFVHLRGTPLNTLPPESQTTHIPFTEGDIFVSSNHEKHPQGFYESSKYHSLKVGFFDATTGENQVFLQTNLESLKGVQIIKATLHLLTAHSYLPYQPTGAWIDRVDGAWGPSTLDWNQSQTLKSTNIGSTHVCQGEWTDFNVTDTVQKWVNYQLPNNGFKLHTNGNKGPYWKKFYSSKEEAKGPYLSITYIKSPGSHSLDSNNLLLNPNFEKIDDKTNLPLKWKGIFVQDQGTILPNSAQKRSSYLPIQITPKTTSDEFGYCALAQVIPVKANTTYTLSGYIKTDQLTNTAAFFNIYQLNLKQDVLTPIRGSGRDNRDTQLTDTQEWTWRELSFITSSEASYICIMLEVDHAHKETSGYALFDGIEFKEKAIRGLIEEEEDNFKDIGVEDERIFDDIDPLSQAKIYNERGNLLYASKQFRIGYRSVVNPFFARSGQENMPEGWQKYEVRSSGEIHLDELQKVHGMQSVRITPPSLGTSSGSTGIVQAISVEPNITYTLSAYLKTEKLNKAKGFLRIEQLVDQGGTLVVEPALERSNQYSHMVGTHDWVMRQLTFTTGSEVSQVRIFLQLDHEASAIGSVWFDQVQFEEGAIPTAFNLIEDGSFEKGLKHWSALEGKPAIDPDYQTVILKRGAPEESPTRVMQTIVLNQTTPLPITITGLSQAKNLKYVIETPSNEYEGITIEIIGHEPGSVYKEEIFFPVGTYDWVRGAKTIVPSAPIKALNIYLNLGEKLIGTTLFDRIHVEVGRAMVEYKYGMSKFPIEVRDVMGYRSQMVYDPLKLRVVHTDPKENEWVYTYYSADRQDEGVTGEGESEEEAEERGAGQIKSLEVPGADVKILYTYNPDGSIIRRAIIKKTNESEIYSQTTYAYDENSRLTLTVDALGNKTEYVYSDNKNSSTVSEEGSIEYLYSELEIQELYQNKLRFKYSYNTEGNKTELYDANLDMTRVYIFDDAQQVVFMSSFGLEVKWSYNENFQLVKRVMGNKYEFNYEYNIFQQNTVIKDSQQKEYYFDYEETGFVSSFIAPNRSFSTYLRDEKERVTYLRIATKEGVLIAEQEYVYDGNDNRIAVKEQGVVVVHYEYDAQNQLLCETYPQAERKLIYTYDPVGNRVTKKVEEKKQEKSLEVYKYNSLNELIMVSDQKYFYDKQGNLTDDGKREYTWDVGGCLIAVKEKGNVGQSFAVYDYDEEGRRIRSTVNGKITHYIYDGDQITVLGEANATNEIEVLYTYSTSGQILSMMRVDEQKTYYYHANAHKDIIAITDDSGKVVAEYAYDAWGNIIKEKEDPDFAGKNKYFYTGYRWDRETGFYYLISRHYNSRNGNFLALDPYPGDLLNLHSQNGYCYVGNNPVTREDPDGCLFWFAVNLGFAAYDGYQAYKRGEGWKGVLGSSALGLIGGGRFKLAGKALKFIKKGLPSIAKRGKTVNKLARSGTPKSGGSKTSSNPKLKPYPRTNTVTSKSMAPKKVLNKEPKKISTTKPPSPTPPAPVAKKLAPRIRYGKGALSTRSPGINHFTGVQKELSETAKENIIFLRHWAVSRGLKEWRQNPPTHGQLSGAIERWKDDAGMVLEIKGEASRTAPGLRSGVPRFSVKKAEKKRGPDGETNVYYNPFLSKRQNKNLLKGKVTKKERAEMLHLPLDITWLRP